MSFRIVAMGSGAFLTAVLWLSHSGKSTEADSARLSMSEKEFADTPGSGQLARHIATQREIITRIQALLEGLKAPEPIYATERSALPVNRLEIAEYSADFNEYSAAITAAKVQLRALQQLRAEAETTTPQR